jgi:6,7-dimethyl-8-ribityllumazine synthase
MHNNTFSQNFDGSNLKIAIVRARFNDEITSALLEGALEGLQKFAVKVDNIEVYDVPGAFEIPLAAQTAAQKDFDAVICLGAVIRGDTPHFEYVCEAATSGILQVTLKTEKPIIFGVITVNNYQQATDRSVKGEGNKGYEAAMAALETVEVLRKIKNS